MIILHDRYHAIVVWAFFKERRSFLEFSISLDAWVCLHLLNHIYMLDILNNAIALFRAHWSGLHRPKFITLFNSVMNSG